jgi:quinol monooxygenase YgiN
VIRTFLDLRVRPGHAEQLADTFRRLGILDASVAQPGCSSAELSVSSDGTLVTVTATWESEAAYAAWTSRADRSDLAEQLNEHLAQPLDASTVGRVHRVLVRAHPGRGPGFGGSDQEGGDR